ncbi:adenine-specific DNA-methyltransferase [Chryseobacterium contaminans]|uniref:site-specific DNA-methyltransferase (adenine-specific) n=4 Tax=Chryseobacterium contaminans TaxID=1423959 RepID=A0A1M7AUF2_9FLAO|nr:site-specific DNA-methyltransferase [Chryseobacterium contaminans]SHL46352.1 adenine-specific DNA-methyltransferase [Chryseobacterium contaminans]
MKLYQTLENQIKKEPNYVSDNGEIKKWVVLNKAQNFDEELIGLLLEDTDLKEKFFIKVKDIWVFKQNLFIQFLEQKNYLNDSYTQFKNKVGLTIDGKHLKQRNEVSLVWPFKDCILEGGQSREEDKREEIFFNEVLAQDEITELLDPKVLTNVKRFDKNGEHHFDQFNRDENGTITDNLIIKGNNLLALHSLKKEFAGKVKLIYIDPPFNTGNDSFKYNDKFNRSSWLTFMKNRLMISREILSSDGNIFIHIDINEIHYLKILCDEVFGKENFVEEIIWAYGSPSGGRAAGAKPVNIHDTILHYSKSYSDRKQNKIFIPYTEKYIKDWFKYDDGDGRLYQRRMRGKDESGNSTWVKQYLDESKGVPLSTVWSDIKQVYADPRAYKENQLQHTELLKEFSGGQKPEALLKRIIEMCTDKNDIILDFHLGTGTTVATAHKLNRQYIGIEQMDYIKELTCDRLCNIIKGNQTGISKSVNWQGGGSFIYLELKKYNQTFIEKIEEAKDEKMLLQIWEEMKQKSFLNYNVDIQKQEQHIEDFKTLSLQEQKQHLCELLDKNQLYVNLSSLKDKNFACTPEEQKVTQQFYQLKN